MQEGPVYQHIDRRQRQPHPDEFREGERHFGPLLRILYDDHVAGRAQDGEVAGDGASRRHSNNPV